MDRNESNPGMIERQLDDAPMQGSPTEREGMERGNLDRDEMRGDGVERESMQGDGVEREGMERGSLDRDEMRGDGPERDSMQGSERGDRQGGYGYDRPADLNVSRDTDERGDRSSGNTPARDW